MIFNVSKTGGHLGSSLGVVELTVALHYVFNAPQDRILWDVGHQVPILLAHSLALLGHVFVLICFELCGDCSLIHIKFLLEGGIRCLLLDRQTGCRVSRNGRRVNSIALAQDTALPPSQQA